jgi:hypothetical protein
MMRRLIFVRADAAMAGETVTGMRFVKYNPPEDSADGVLSCTTNARSKC